MPASIVMPRASRLVASAFALALAAALGGCGSFATPSWDPTDLLNFLDNEKRTPGERKPVFPEGVPGISQGVPPEMIKGNAQQPVAPDATTATVTPPVEAQPSPPPPSRRARATPSRPPAQNSGVEIAPDDVNVGESPAAGRQAPQQPNPFPAPISR